MCRIQCRIVPDIICHIQGTVHGKDIIVTILLSCRRWHIIRVAFDLDQIIGVVIKDTAIFSMTGRTSSRIVASPELKSRAPFKLISV